MRHGVGGRNHPHVHRLLVAPAEPAELALLQHAQQLHLRGRCHLRDLVEEQRAAIGQLETALAAIEGAGECALLVPEDLALEQRFRNRGAVDRDKRLLLTGTELVDGLRDQFLARPRLAPDEDRGRGGRRLLDDLVDLPHLRTAADHRPERALIAQLLAQHLHLAQGVVPLHDLVEEDLQPLGFDGFGQVVVGAVLDGLDRRFHGSLRGEDEHRVVPAVVRQGPQQFEPTHPGHDQVRDDDRRAEAGDARERFFPVARGFSGEPPGTNQFGQPEPRGCFVLYNEDTFAGDVGSHKSNPTLSFLHGPEITRPAQPLAGNCADWTIRAESLRSGLR